MEATCWNASAPRTSTLGAREPVPLLVRSNQCTPKAPVWLVRRKQGLPLEVSRKLGKPWSSRRVLVVPFAALDLKEQMREYAAAEKRWLKQVSEGKVKALTPKEAGYSYQLADNVLLDVRPSFERNKGWVKDSVWVPAFEVDKSLAPGALWSKLTLFLFGGWWNGTQVTKRNERFMVDVAAEIPKSANIIVGCQRGLRSLAACEHLYKAGYRNLSWIKEGFEAAEEEDFKREGPVPLKFAGLGGVSEFIGLTEQQRIQAKKEGLGYRAVFWARTAGLLIALDLLYIAFQNLTSSSLPANP